MHDGPGHALSDDEARAYAILTAAVKTPETPGNRLPEIRADVAGVLLDALDELNASRAPNGLNPRLSDEDRLEILGYALDAALDELSAGELATYQAGSIATRIRNITETTAAIRRNAAAAPTTNPLEPIAVAARKLLDAAEGARLSREHFPGRLEALVDPLNALHVELDAAGR